MVSLSELYIACCGGDEDLVRGLLASLEYNEINRREPNGSTPLHAAVCHGHVSIVRLLLLEFHVDRRQRNNHSLTAYQEAQTDNIRQLFHRPNQAHQRFCDVQPSPFEIYTEHNQNEENGRATSNYVGRMETNQKILGYRQLLSMSKHIWSSELGQKYFTLYTRFVDPTNAINMVSFIKQFKKLIDETLPPDHNLYPRVQALFNEYEQTQRPEPLLTLYTLNSPLYVRLTENIDNSPVLLHIIWRHLRVLTPRFFRGTAYRGLSMKYDDLKEYQWALENNDRTIGTYRFCSSSTDRCVAEAFGDIVLPDRIRTVIVFNFDQPCNGAIQLYSLSPDLPCISNFEEEREVLILPGTIFRVWKIEDDQHTGYHIIYLNHIPDAENPGLHVLGSVLSEARDNLIKWFSFRR
ncbi:unnamed protein product [Adineta steineri]|uniref:Uncharacterized protein n=1 Tax=Adineta steineri TaxID=433720 RepID=A0A814K2G2_9BILA|nr:unnamed protein product [Adineta steineri]CAF3555871.1 unnamed protein product [Adineta steineri]